MDHDWDSSSSTDGLDVSFDGRGSMLLVVLFVSFVESEEDVVKVRMMLLPLPKGDAGVELAVDDENSLEEKRGGGVGGCGGSLLVLGLMISLAILADVDGLLPQ